MIENRKDWDEERGGYPSSDKEISELPLPSSSPAPGSSSIDDQSAPSTPRPEDSE
jgi:hypothetical protein